MILRLLRATLPPERVPDVVSALRAEADAVRGWSGIVAWTHGLRWEAGRIHGLTVSAWTDFDAVLRHARGRPDRDVSSVSSRVALDDVAVDHYELTEPEAADAVDLSGQAIGVLRGTIRPHVEERVAEMLRAIRPTVLAAGVEALYVGRRVGAAGTEIVAVAVWRDRLSLHEFARTRDVGAIDPAFTAELDPWRFETYDAIAPDRLTAGMDESLGTGAALVVDDEGTCVDSTPGVEWIVGVPGELFLHHRLDDLVVDPGGADEITRAIAAGRPTTSDLTLRTWSAGPVRVRAALELDIPRRGLHCLRLGSVEAADRPHLESTVAAS